MHYLIYNIIFLIILKNCQVFPGLNIPTSFEESFLDDKDLITLEKNNILEQPFTETEQKKAVFYSEANGAPGPDGFTFRFSQYLWDLVKFYLLVISQKFYDHSLALQKLNKAIVCLIRKKKEALNIKQFRPISLVNCSLKILSKMLTTPLMHRFVDNTLPFLKIYSYQIM